MIPMTLEEELKKRYPREVELQDGTKVTFRPIQKTDEAALLAYFKGLPLQERELFRDDVTDPSVIKKWCTAIDYENILPILAFEGDRIVADATAHRHRSRASSHVARLRVTVGKEFRGHGLATRLIGELVELAPVLKLACLDAEVFPEQERALKVFEDLGFLTVGTLPQHMRDLKDTYHDVILMTLMATPPERLSPDCDAEGADIGGSG